MIVRVVIGTLALLFLLVPASAGIPGTMNLGMQGYSSPPITDLTFNGVTTTSGPLEPGEVVRLTLALSPKYPCQNVTVRYIIPKGIDLVDGETEYFYENISGGDLQETSVVVNVTDNSHLLGLRVIVSGYVHHNSNDTTDLTEYYFFCRPPEKPWYAKVLESVFTFFFS
ncbi:hypothetical protein ABH15_08775 [Methanoculleus taiwanensis]|uniref:Uncharacterized protein n=1 Tax=Methanoculleus taiwanensis TaxID=1550565 RepID=A0A498H294_9EURY|nr:hypothetical protein [Methanoculleus taiwanensis]RXE56230.1 hypothetical protein ABH15_08775 [Methanoculleus taiwanensis]